MLSQYDKPCIRLAYTADAPPAWLKALCSGMEEEMIPYEMQEAAADDLFSLAFTAAEASRLQVGLAVSPRGAALHYAKLSPAQPLFSLDGGSCEPEALRTLGANAARLVKGISFKE